MSATTVQAVAEVSSPQTGVRPISVEARDRGHGAGQCGHPTILSAAWANQRDSIEPGEHQLDGPLDTLADIAADLGRVPTLAGRTLRFGGPAELTTTLLLPALADVLAADVTIRTRLGLADDLLGELAGGQLDLVVSTRRPLGSELHTQPLYDEEFVMVASPALAARLDPDQLADRPAKVLANMPLLAYAEDLPVVRRWWRHVLGSPPPRRAAPIPTDDPPINTLYLTTRTATRLEPHIEYAWAALRRHALRW